MARHKKNNTIQIEAKEEVKMTDNILENDAQKEIEAIEQETDRVRQELEAAKRELKEIQEKKDSARRVYSAEEERISEKMITAGNERKAMESSIARQKEIDNEKITGRFMNRRAPGQPAKLTYMKYADDPVKWYYFEDGKTYTIPRGFADQINEYYHSPVFIQKPQGSVILSETIGENSMIQEVDRSNKKYAFVPMNF
jgi:hypothetical protein